MITKSINYEMEKNIKFQNEIKKCIVRHINCDFGELGEEDIKANLNDIRNKEGHILSRYKTSKGDIYINTQKELYDYNEKGEPILKIITMIMFCEEY